MEQERNDEIDIIKVTPNNAVPDAQNDDEILGNEAVTKGINNIEVNNDHNDEVSDKDEDNLSYHSSN